MSKSTDDDLEAVRLLASTLEPFDIQDRNRIIRWACEKLGMSPDRSSSHVVASPSQFESTNSPQPSAALPTDIKSFINQKDPKSDNHLAAVVAYFHHFQASPGEQKDAITKEDLIDACRRADRKRPARPAQVLVNAYHAGLLDKSDRAHYRLNSVGENLVAMVLPESETQSSRSAPRRRKPAKKKAPRKKAKRSKRS